MIIMKSNKIVEKDELNLERYPKEFQKFLKKEVEIVKELVNSDDKVLDIGCGKGRAIPEISPLVSEYLGIDIYDNYLFQARVFAKKFENSRIVKLNVENLSDSFIDNVFYNSFCLFNTISCFKNYKKALKEIYHVTKNKFYFSVCAKGSKNIRQKYYDMIGVEVKFDKNETAYSKAWGQVKAFNEDEIKTLCKEIGFKIKKIILINGYGYGVIVCK